MNNTFTILIGVPAVGKSTYIEHNLMNSSSKVISSDVIRMELFNSLVEGNTQNGNQKTWQLVNRRLKQAFISKEPNIILDATNLRRKRRIPYYNQAHRYGYYVNAVWFEIPYKDLVHRNESRQGTDKYIFPKILKAMFVNLEPPINDLDCDSVVTCHNNIYEGYRIGYSDLYNYRLFVKNFLGTDPFNQEYENGKWHKESIESHLKLTSIIGSMTKYPQQLKAVGLWHDIGKDFVRNWVEKDKTWTYYNHDILSARLFLTYMEQLNTILPHNTFSIYKVIRWHMMALKGLISPKVIKREHLSSKELDMLRIFAKIDSFSRIGREGYETELSNIIK